MSEAVRAAFPDVSIPDPPFPDGAGGFPSRRTVSLDDPILYVNREWSLLQFQRRVLEEAQDPANPPLERVKFLSIVGSNLDEFFMVRVAGLKKQVEAGIYETGPDGVLPRQSLAELREEVTRIYSEAHECRESLLRELAEFGVKILPYAEISPAQREALDRYFENTIYPVLTPLAFDLGRPFPHISNLSLNLSVIIRDRKGKENFARLKVPPTLPQLIPLITPARAGAGRPHAFVWLEEVIQGNLPKLFPGMEVVASYAFHVTRDADLAIQAIESEDLLDMIEEGVRQRRFGDVVRLKVDAGMPEPLIEILKENLEIEDADIYRMRGPLSLSRLRHLTAIDRPDLKDPLATPVNRLEGRSTDIFAAIRQSDILLHHPFDSFQPVVDFLRAAARDPHVMAIKMTLYRVGRNSPVVEALLEAMERGKQVAVLVELKARFDEESNIEWARALENEGVHVVYGLVGLKIHAKVALVVRREGDVMRRYVHLSTGNYNAVTAHLYTDLGLFTCHPEFGADASDLFNYLTGYSAKSDYRKLLVAPVTLRARMEAMIEREIGHARAGRPAHLIFKVNALVDPRITKLLYHASRAGVKVDLLARGICSLRPGVPEISENIRVRSVVGRYLEHSRIFYCANGGDEEIYLGSADLMPRNIDRRVEVLFPIEQPALRHQIRHQILETYLQDNVKARQMLWDGTYARVTPALGEKPVNAQAVLAQARDNGGQ